MLFELPILYKITGVKKGQTRAMTYTVAEIVEVDIAAASDDDAPIAVEWDARTKMSTAGPEPIFSAIPPFPTEGNAHTRLFSDRHYCPALVLSGLHEGRFVSPEELQESRGFGIWGDIFSLRKLGPKQSIRSIDDLRKHCLITSSGGDDLFSRIERTGRVEVLRALHIAASDCVFVNDRLYRACAAPEIVMANFPLYLPSEEGEIELVSPEVRQLFVTHDPEFTAAKLERKDFFDLTDWKEVSRHVAHYWNHFYGDILNSINKSAAPTISPILNDDTYKRNAAIYEHAESFMRKVRQKNIGDLDPDTLIAFAGLEKAFVVMRLDGGMDILEQAAVEFSQVAARGAKTDVMQSQSIQPLLDLLSDRPVNVSPDWGFRPA